MVKGATSRTKKYGAKIDADVVRARISALKDSMVESATVRQAEISAIQADVKAELDSLGIPPEFVVPFMRIAMKIYGLTLKHKGATLVTEVNAYLSAVAVKLYAFCKNANKVQEFLEWLVNYFGITGAIVPPPPS